MTKGLVGRLLGAVALATASLAGATPALANDTVETAFDRALGTSARKPVEYSAPTYGSQFERQVAILADGGSGRIGVAAIDLATGQEIGVLGDQRFPMASTSKIAIAATFLEGVDQGRWSLTSEFPLMIPVRSAAFSSARAPVKAGQYLPAHELIELMITRSSNPATDALLAAVGGPSAVNDWARRAGIKDFNLTRDIATLVRDDGEVDPATRIDVRDSATPRAMVQLLSGIYQGKWLKQSSRAVIMGAMERCRTGTRRIPAMMPEAVIVAHKTGSLSNTSSDIGVITTPDGRSIAVAIYVTGQGGRANREAKIASIARAIYDGYTDTTQAQWVDARYKRSTN
jgi:beta-lactamase class A